MKLVISDAHEGLKAAVTKVLSATWQRCRVHYADVRIMPIRLGDVRSTYGETATFRTMMSA